MLKITRESQILVAREAIDFRKGIDGIVHDCLNVLGHSGNSGAFFVFCNRSRSMVRVLHYDGNGYWLCTKRLSKGRFKKLCTVHEEVLSWRAVELVRFLQISNFCERKKK